MRRTGGRRRMRRMGGRRRRRMMGIVRRVRRRGRGGGRGRVGVWGVRKTEMMKKECETRVNETNSC